MPAFKKRKLDGASSTSQRKRTKNSKKHEAEPTDDGSDSESGPQETQTKVDETLNGSEPEPVPTKSFEELGVIEGLCEACKNLGFTKPTPVQEQAIPVGLEKRDIIGLAETGSGP
jgi:ATP-dependent RNA helicase DDX47/RRP3